jgi:hypothetical protein
LEIVIGEGAPITAAQEWAKMLGELNVGNVQIRGARSTDQVEIKVEQAGNTKTYRVIGMLTSANELQVPGKKFRMSDGSRIADWLNGLAEEGPVEPGQAEVPFGLRRQEFAGLRRRMAQPVAISTAGEITVKVVSKLNRQLGDLCIFGRSDLALIGQAKPVRDELQGLAAGTALAAVLRSLGLGMAPRRGQSADVNCGIVEIGPDVAVWPVGLSGENRRKELLPILFEFLNVEIDNFTVNEVLESVGPRMNVPILFDWLALEHHEIDPAKVTASLPARRTSYSVLLQKVLMQAQLKFELRVDDAGKPFLWITTIKKI